MNHATALPIVVAGATGDLGHRVVRALAERGAHVIALVRPGTEPARLNGLRNSTTTITPVSLDDAQGLRRAVAGSGCVVSTLNGLEEVIIEQQGRLLEAAVAAGVPRFIPSDYSLDYTRTRPGDNRNLDLRRRFVTQLDAADISVTSILNGGFLELLEGDAPIVLPGRRVLHFGDAQQSLDFTAKDDVAAFTADAALDSHTPRFLRIAGNSLSPAQIASLLTELTGQRYRTLRPGNIGTLSTLIGVVRALTPASDKPFPAWQGMQYLRDMMSGRGKLLNLDNDRYGQREWASVRDTLARTHVQGSNQ
ncbi:NmrA family NAD(P)-binding protein [Pseudomonas syringae]|uniref:NmrA family NAD(P)-binding protein n=1 Tax=Pseudomonas syringae TaxID=317 RepID=UPI000FE0D6CC|nr:NmrA family NAD(P)-binding protein [Pseudomonas syringae]MCK9707706.1 NmrA family NAD(P)-binding protein [Pseudomonas syringae pv. syringae]NAO30038.1 NmrA family protein [Pseudomonas syringae pv. dysoxyli]MCK9778629.1 NmrA family NAD(P)-binding protein [Pseudomonas syringae pv. syringae]MDU8571959.1 NmrA family NAD(P)-binding protein [Pseudomonas syringae]MDU8621729.1 NmrA family NAD(P)-binding protein [Pseudomonas syringae]